MSNIYHVSCSLKGLELQLAACRQPAWHEGSSTNYMCTEHKGLKTYVSED